MIDKNVVARIVEEWLEDKSYFLVDVNVSPDDKIVVEIDHAATTLKTTYCTLTIEYQPFATGAVSSKIKPGTFGKFEKKEKADANMDSFLSFYIGITYLSYCIRDNTLKEKELGAVSPYLFFLLLSYCLTAIIQHLKNKNYDLSGS